MCEGIQQLIDEGRNEGRNDNMKDLIRKKWLKARVFLLLLMNLRKLWKQYINLLLPCNHTIKELLNFDSAYQARDGGLSIEQNVAFNIIQQLKDGGRKNGL